MTHQQYFAVKKTLASGKFPQGIRNANDFQDFASMAKAYLTKKNYSTVRRSVYDACNYYGIPMKDTGMGVWELVYQK